MDCNSCAGCSRSFDESCRASADPSVAYKEVVATRREKRLTRRETIFGAAAVALLALGRLPGGSLATAYASTISQKFHKPAGSRKVGSLHSLHAGSALAIRDPRTGGPAVIVRPNRSKTVHAFSAVCTHAGCTVNFNPANKLLVCPCHGSVYDPAHGASVLQGPAPYPLASLKVAVDPKGNIWLV